MLTIEQRVAAGAAWLDRTRPGWVDEVDLDRLEMTECKSCVLGQIVVKERDIVIEATENNIYAEELEEMIVGYDSLVEATREELALLRQIDDLERLVMTHVEAEARGFHTGGTYDAANPEWQDLTDEWRRVIVARCASKEVK